LARGTLFIVSAPSGAGKTSLVRTLIQQVEHLLISISHTTRAPRPKEQNGIDYHFVSVADFEAMLAKAQFLEHARVFDNYYGTSSVWVNEQLAAGQDVILEIDWQGAQQVRQLYPDSVSIFIVPPSQTELANRLRGRAQDSEEVINRRLQEAVSEMQHYAEFDYLVINDVFEQALQELQTIVLSQRLKVVQQSQRHTALLQQLLA